MSKISTYFQSWSSTWTSNPATMDLALISGVNIVNISFASPDCQYVPGQKTFSNTGLDFSQDFATVAGAISLLKQRGVVVMLSVGGATYWSTVKAYNALSLVALITDLGCNGIDLDWEVGITDSSSLTNAILTTNSISKCLISFAGWSTGCYQPAAGSPYQGMNIDAITKAGSLVSWINVMAYDAGPPSQFSPISAYQDYRIYFPGPLILGIELGQQSWGGYVTQLTDIVNAVTYVAIDGKQNGIFTWSWQKDSTGSPTIQKVNQLAQAAFIPPTPPPPPPPSPTAIFQCPNCAISLLVTKSV